MFAIVTITPMSTFRNLTCNINENIHKVRVNDIVYGQNEIIFLFIIISIDHTNKHPYFYLKICLNFKNL